MSARRSQQLKQILHRTAAADDALEAVTLIELLAQPGVLGAQPPLFHGALERVPAARRTGTAW